MISGQLLIEEKKAKLSNIIVKESISPAIKGMRVSSQLEPVIAYLTKNVIDNSNEGSDVFIRLYPDKFNIVFEVEDSHTSNKVNHQEDKSIDYVICTKIIDSLGGSMSRKKGDIGDISYFKLPANTLAPSEQINH